MSTAYEELGVPPPLKASMYEMARFRSSTLSPSCPIPELHERQSNPRTAPVLWLWSMHSFFRRPQIAQRWFCFSLSTCSCSSVSPTFLARCLSLALGSALYLARLAARAASLFLWYQSSAEYATFSLFPLLHCRARRRQCALFSRYQIAPLALTSARTFSDSAYLLRILALISSRCRRLCWRICSLCDSRYRLRRAAAFDGDLFGYRIDQGRLFSGKRFSMFSMIGDYHFQDF